MPNPFTLTANQTKMLINFSKAWGQDDCRWNYCGGDWNFRTMSAFMVFYGIREAWIIGKMAYFEGEKEVECNEFAGRATM